MVEVFVASELQIGRQFRSDVFGVADHGYVADFVTRPFVDDVMMVTHFFVVATLSRSRCAHKNPRPR